MAAQGMISNLDTLIHRARELGFKYKISMRNNGVELRYMGADIFMDEKRAIEFFLSYLKKAKAAQS